MFRLVFAMLSTLAILPVLLLSESAIVSLVYIALVSVFDTNTARLQ